MSETVSSAKRSALILAETHYENFPVVSFLTPKKLRPHIALIYAFARGADDVADEGNISDAERVQQLDEYISIIDRIKENKCSAPFETALRQTINEFHIPHSLFYDLISAFKQDVVKKSYASSDELKDYAIRSANPIGRLILILYGYREPRLFELSDNICSALQFINFLQDVSVDREKERCYIPDDILGKYGLSNSSVFDENNRETALEIIRELVREYRKLLYSGAGLEAHLSGLLKYQIRWTILGGDEILSKIEKIKYNVFQNRVSLTKLQFLSLFFKSLIYARRNFSIHS